MRSDFIHI